jgi:hypothetical protein
MSRAATSRRSGRRRAATSRAGRGSSVGAISPGLDALRLRRFQTEDGEELVDVPRALLPPRRHRGAGAVPADLGRDAARPRSPHRDGPEKYRPRIFHTKNPQSVPTFLVDGSVAGTWRYDAGKVDLEPFHRLGRAADRALREEAGRLAGLLA